MWSPPPGLDAPVKLPYQPLKLNVGTSRNRPLGVPAGTKLAKCPCANHDLQLQKSVVNPRA